MTTDIPNVLVYQMISIDQAKNKNRKTPKYRPSTVTIKKDIFIRELGFFVTLSCTFITKCVNDVRNVNVKISNS